MAAQNSERLLNLVIALLVTDRFLSRERIREIVEGYSQAKTEAGFQRMFERDKEDLRALGIEILVGSTDPDSDELDGYRVRPDDFYLPAIELTPAESTLVGLASSVWNEPTMAANVERAIAKLRASGQQISSGHVGFLTPRLTAREPAFAVLWQALLTRTPVAFAYHGRRRVVWPWKLILRSGAWYLLGENVDVGARMFRLSRIETAPVLAGEPGSYDLPDAAVVAAHAQSLAPAEPTDTVVVALRESAAGELRRRGTAVDQPVPDGFEAVRIPYAREDEIVSAICAAGPDALVIQTGSVRDRVIAQLRAVVQGGAA